MERAPLSLTRAVAMTGLVALGAFLAPGLPFVGVPVAAFALASLAAEGRPWLAVIVALLGAAAVALVSPSSALFVAPALLACGPVAAWAVRRMPALGVVALLTVVLALASVGAEAVGLSAQGTTVVAAVRESGTQLVKAAEAAARELKDPAYAEVIRTQATTWADTAFMLWPAGVARLAMLTALLGVLAVTRAASQRGIQVNKLPRLEELDISIHIVWFGAAALFALAAARFAGPAAWMTRAAGANVLLVIQLPFLAQGMGVFAALMRRSGVSTRARRFAYVAMVLLDLMFYVVSVIGVIDMWANFRGLPRDGMQPTSGLEPPPAA